MKMMTLFFTVGLILGAKLAVQASPLTWDANPTSASGAQDGSGNWTAISSTATNWWTGSANVAWNNANNDTAIFHNPQGGPRSHTITITDPVTVGGLQFSGNYDAYTLTASGSGMLNLGLSGTIITCQIAGVVSTPVGGPGGFTKTGASILYLSVSNSFSGESIVNTRLNVRHRNALGDPAAGTTINNGGYISFDNIAGVEGTIAEPFTLNGGTLKNDRASSVVLSGSIKVIADSLISSYTIYGDRKLFINGGISNNGVNLTLSGESAPGGPVTINGVISGTGTVTIGNDGSYVTFFGSNTFSGTIMVNSNKSLALGNAVAIKEALVTQVDKGASLHLGNFDNAAVVGGVNFYAKSLILNGGRIYVQRDEGNTTWTGPITLTADSKIGVGGYSRNLTLASSSTVDLSTNTLTIDNIGRGVTINSKITGSGGLSVTNVPYDSTTALSLNNSSNDYSGPTIIEGTINRVKLLVDNATSSNSDVVVKRFYLSGDGGLHLNGKSTTIGALSGTGTVYGTSSKTLTIGANNHSGTFDGIISGTINVTKTGIGTQYLNGSNTFSGVTTVMNGFIGGNGFLSDNLAVSSGGGFAAKVGSSLKIKGNIDLSTSTDSLMLVGAKPQGRNTIITYSGTRSGTFNVVTGVKVDYSVPGEIAILPLTPGTVMTLR